MEKQELINIITKFAESGWDVLSSPAKKWLSAKDDQTAKVELISAIRQADQECGSCGCEFDPLYKIALDALNS